MLDDILKSVKVKKSKKEVFYEKVMDLLGVDDGYSSFGLIPFYLRNPIYDRSIR